MTEPVRTVEEHAEQVRELLGPALAVGIERIPLSAALGRLTAGGVLSPVDLPLFRNSQMDGFAVRAADLGEVPVSLPIVGEIAARAAAPATLARGTSVRIMTGAVVPEGADAVIPVEDTTVDGTMVTIRRPRGAGEYVRDRGSDVHAGEQLLPDAQLLASRHLAVLAAAGIDYVDVHRRVRVAVITTGAELVSPGTAPEPGQVFDANAVALVAAVTASGGVVTLQRRVDDDPALLLAAMGEAIGEADIILTSGGISHGDYEVVRELLEPAGAWVGHVAMQPGGPQATAQFEGVPVVCFPGNPVSTQLSFEVFVAPLLREVAGLPAAVVARRQLASDVRSAPGKRQFLRGRVTDGDRVETVSGAGSHLVAGLAASDVLIIVPEDVTALSVGDEVETLRL
jgi:molybdopterin molybdotransferase